MSGPHVKGGTYTWHRVLVSTEKKKKKRYDRSDPLLYNFASLSLPTTWSSCIYRTLFQNTNTSLMYMFGFHEKKRFSIQNSGGLTSRSWNPVQEPARPNENEIITRRWTCVDCSSSAWSTGIRGRERYVRKRERGPKQAWVKTRRWSCLQYNAF